MQISSNQLLSRGLLGEVLQINHHFRNNPQVLKPSEHLEMADNIQS